MVLIIWLEGFFKVLEAHYPSDKNVVTVLGLVWGQCRGQEAMGWRPEGWEETVRIRQFAVSDVVPQLQDNWGGRIRPG